jgi:hypothetical protein
VRGVEVAVREQVTQARDVGPGDQGSGHGARQAGSLDRLTWLFVAMGRLLLALGAPKLM